MLALALSEANDGVKWVSKRVSFEAKSPPEKRAEMFAGITL